MHAAATEAEEPAEEARAAAREALAPSVGSDTGDEDQCRASLAALPPPQQQPPPVHASPPSCPSDCGASPAASVALPVESSQPAASLERSMSMALPIWPPYCAAAAAPSDSPRHSECGALSHASQETDAPLGQPPAHQAPHSGALPVFAAASAAAPPPAAPPPAALPATSVWSPWAPRSAAYLPPAPPPLPPTATRKRPAVQVVDEPLDHINQSRKRQICAECAQYYARLRLPLATTCRAECRHGRAHDEAQTPASFWGMDFNSEPPAPNSDPRAQRGLGTQSSTGGSHDPLWSDD